MKLVSDQSEETARTNRAVELVGQILQKMTANLLRVIAGAGHRYDVPNDMIDVVRGLAEAPERFPTERLLDRVDGRRACLGRFDEAEPDDRARWLSDGTFRVAEAEWAVYAASLRVVAARINNINPTVYVNAHTAFRVAVDDLNEAIAEARQKRRMG